MSSNTVCKADDLHFCRSQVRVTIETGVYGFGLDCSKRYYVSPLCIPVSSCLPVPSFCITWYYCQSTFILNGHAWTIFYQGSQTEFESFCIASGFNLCTVRVSSAWRMERLYLPTTGCCPPWNPSCRLVDSKGYLWGFYSRRGRVGEIKFRQEEQRYRLEPVVTQVCYLTEAAGGYNPDFLNLN